LRVRDGCEMRKVWRKIGDVTSERDDETNEGGWG
jgi:hypothetical protein